LERDFNTIDLEGHPPDAFEQAMASVESDIGSALTRINEAQSLADENHRTLLLNLLGLLHIRILDSRRSNALFKRTLQSGYWTLRCPAVKYGNPKSRRRRMPVTSTRMRTPTTKR